MALDYLTNILTISGAKFAFQYKGEQQIPFEIVIFMGNNFIQQHFID